ncbi:hypothetical protein Lal_00013437 [Lupinus albus]|nr:hypothetical protein Lal_00013437 [Lupinus albus]
MDDPPQANVIYEPLVVLLYEVNMVGGSDGCWVDIGTSFHICYYHVDDKKVLLVDSRTTVVIGTSDVEWKFTYEKIMILKDVKGTPLKTYLN